ncbi:DUF2126 domain-containing protein [Parvularcula marina]|uniref:transglutaminase family protein n=1 Tax=Parvularcula marina TaxID=2292771 RepID=UPI0035171059
MSIDVALTHRTRYVYDKAIAMGPQIVRLRPAPHSRTHVKSFGLKISPEEHFLNWQQDPFGNYLARLVIPEKTKSFEVVVDLVADLSPINPFDFFLEEEASETPFAYDKGLLKELAPYLELIEGGSLFERLVVEERRNFQKGDGTIDFFVGINQRLEQAIRYTTRMEPGVQTPEETLKLAVGSCRDSAWLMVALMRRLGIAARFVSGYLIQLKADEKSLEGPSGPEEDFTDLHAWTEVYLPGAGWVGLDPTSGLFAGEGHIPLAATPSPQSAAPISGGHEPAEVEFDFEMSVTRVYETTRVTSPMSENQWAAIREAGEKIDERLNRNDVRLTMGGEPTFVASTDRDAEEWNIDAVGPTKRIYADKLIRKFRDRFAPGGLLQYGQGKWYPGEQLPRWAFALYWRRDHVPLWQDPSLIATENGPRQAGAPEAERFMSTLCGALGVDEEYAQPAFEDPAAYLFQESKLPPNVDPLDNKLEDPESRARLAKVFDRGLSTPAAFVLPIQVQQGRARASRACRWVSEKWKTRRGRIYLNPGDSPSGFRLPLTSLTYLDPRRRPDVYPLDPFAARGALPAREPTMQRPMGAGGDALPPENLPDEIEPDWPDMMDVEPGMAFYGSGPFIRTAMTVEPRDGVICVFLPPVRSGDEFADLIAAIEETSEATGLPVQIEGYSPPPDHRIDVIKVTPDPGVIEVNIHPAHSWREQVDVTRSVYEAARECGLEASKFMIDGRPTGSGGGAHIVVGGATPADSPFLRRPDVLASIIRYWQNHPSLSYFFSGLFIGPTSQAPRLDEARQESLFEMEIALSKVPNPLTSSGADCPPWLVDRLFRHLLTDVTGNTHRAEICIDKLFSPDGPTGRLGLVEFRSFEMPPHYRMNLAQQLLLRALIAWFWEKPYEGGLTRHGTLLHDKFMLPYFLKQDLAEVMSDVSRGTGIAFDPGWFDAQYEFRFPKLGEHEIEGTHIELRAALEPWHVLGEEGTVGGTARFVDSSLERVEVKVRGLDHQRYALLCNGYEVPLTTIEEDGQAAELAGIRYRAWLPPSCLHPTIYPHAPLIFDLYDRKNGRAVGGVTYHAHHPGGRNYETQPVNALEADGRRRARFSTFGSAPGAMSPRQPVMSPEYPTTLDLRIA